MGIGIIALGLVGGFLLASIIGFFVNFGKDTIHENGKDYTCTHEPGNCLSSRAITLWQSGVVSSESTGACGFFSFVGGIIATITAGVGAGGAGIEGPAIVACIAGATLYGLGW